MLTKTWPFLFLNEFYLNKTTVNHVIGLSIITMWYACLIYHTYTCKCFIFTNWIQACYHDTMKTMAWIFIPLIHANIHMNIECKHMCPFRGKQKILFNIRKSRNMLNFIVLFCIWYHEWQYRDCFWNSMHWHNVHNGTICIFRTSDPLYYMVSVTVVSTGAGDDMLPNSFSPLKWRHNGRDSVSKHQPHDCLLNRIFRCRSKKTSKLRVTGLCAGNSPETGEFPAQMASYAKNVAIWWRHHGKMPLFVVSSVTADGLAPSCEGTRHIIIQVWTMYMYQTGTLIANQLIISRVYLIYMYSN